MADENKYTKWVFTWNAETETEKLPTNEELIHLIELVATDYSFQLEEVSRHH